MSQLYASMSVAEGQDGTQRAEMARHIAEARERHEYGAALELLREEESRIRERWKLNLAHEVQELQDHLWVGEKLGLDTTPVMEVFSEAKLALDEFEAAVPHGGL
ncbi:MAG: hypothetical protein L3K07_08630, partial [Thermoplasmata archaeon]|nr:hypothetical protein [Thermoplasmata archaeon]